MDKQKQIEEMAKVLCINDNFVCETCPSKNECFNYKHARQLYNAGYRKISENAVVLGKKDYERLCDLAYFGNGEETIRKETAEKLLDKVDNESNGQTKAITDLLRKEYGVEVK